MFLSENIKEESIITNIKVKNRWEMIETMIDLAEKNGSIASDVKDEVIKALVEREKSMSTGIGNGVAIPHCTTDRVKDITIIIALTPKGVSFDSIDNLPVKIAILLLVPQTKLSKHIKVLASIAKVMSNETLRESLVVSKNSSEIIKKIKNFHKNNQ